ncbi:MAG: NAD-dependent epimerase/dehydratase family protein [Ruminococcus sp.]|nr:NAD-dependent epimerase/dehydratase family protein [Ruminococcus sp.]
MKKILITGKDSYIGTSFENYIRQFEGYIVDTVDMIDGGWRDMSFCQYDVVFHVAGIAHSDFGKISDDRKSIYYTVNTELAIETAKKAKAEGVKQFIFMSSASVYGESAPIGKLKRITKDTPMTPANYYGDSKVKAENGLVLLEDESFNIVILRPPMIYGEGCKGNYPTLSKFARKLPVFPYVKNERSMLYIGNLVEFIKLMIDNNEHGVFLPQNSEYTNTSELVKMISQVNGKNIVLIKGFSWALKIMSKFTGLVNKAFGNLAYDMELSEYKENYRKYTLKESIENTEKHK